MQGLSKRIFFWALVLLFFITAPLVIFRSLGYRFNTQRGIFIYTGSISIESNPLEVEVYIDGEAKSKNLNRMNNSYHIEGIKPGEHLIEVKAPGFNTWSKKITVSSGVSTEFWNVLLTRDDYQKENYPSQGAEKFFFDPGKKLIAYTQSGAEGLSVSVLDLNSNESLQVFSSQEYRFTDDKKENIEWSPQSKKILVPAMKDEKKHYLLVDIKTKEATDLEEFSKEDDMEKARWDQDSKDFIFYLSQGNLHHLDTANPENNKVIAENVASYDISSGYVYYFLLSNGIIYRTNYNDTSEPEQITKSAPDKMGDPRYQITVYDQDRIALLNRSGELYIHNTGEKEEYFKNLSSGISEIQFSNDGKKMLYYDDYEISVYFMRDWEVQPWRNENEQKEIIRFSEKIDNVQWSKDYEHVVFNVGNRIKIAEIDNRSQSNISDVLTLNSFAAEIASDTGEDKLYFTDDNTLHSINFPEEIGLLGF